MAEYIEREALIKELQEEIEFDSPIHNEVENDWLTRGLKIALKDVKRFPTADVVPKSEVDDLKRYIILNEDIAIKCKQENGEQNEEYWKGKISAFRQTLAYIDAELKKKYTEQKNG